MRKLIFVNHGNYHTRSNRLTTGGCATIANVGRQLAGRDDIYPDVIFAAFEPKTMESAQILRQEFNRRRLRMVGEVVPEKTLDTGFIAGEFLQSVLKKLPADAKTVIGVSNAPTILRNCFNFCGQWLDGIAKLEYGTTVELDFPVDSWAWIDMPSKIEVMHPLSSLERRAV